MRERLQLHIKDMQYREIIARYHFAENDLEQLRQVGSLVGEEAKPVIYYGAFAQEEAGGKEGNSALSFERLSVIVTLGSGVDELQNRYAKKERLTESYMVECISMELLRVAYEQAAERIHVHTGKWMSGFEFVGDKIPFDCMEEIFRHLAPQEVSFNQAYMLSPKKTVVFLTDLCEERKGSYCHVCGNCSYISCPDRVAESVQSTMELGATPQITESGRNLTYGYQRIFGMGDKVL